MDLFVVQEGAALLAGDLAGLVSVYSTLEKAKAWVEQTRNPECNPFPYVWSERSTDMEGVDEWFTKSVLFNGETVEIIITRYPLDKTPDELAGC